MGINRNISKIKIYWKKTKGCYDEFGLIETLRRMVRESRRILMKSGDVLDISLVTERLAIGAAPKMLNALRDLKLLGFTNVIDLRAERKSSDILVSTKDVSVMWVPTYDDWRAKPPEFFKLLAKEIDKVFTTNEDKKLFICCGEGKHRAPLAGVIALVKLKYPLELAMTTIQEKREVTELITTYKKSLIDFLKDDVDDC